MDREVTVEQDRPDAAGARQRQTEMVDELRKAELVRDRLEDLQRLVGVIRRATTRACCSRACTSTERSER